MTWHSARYQELFCGRQVSGTLGRGRGVRPGPGGKFVDEVVAGEYEFFGRHLARCAEGGGVRDRGPAVAEGVEGRVDYVHVCVLILKEYMEMGKGSLLLLMLCKMCVTLEYGGEVRRR